MFTYPECQEKVSISTRITIIRDEREKIPTKARISSIPTLVKVLSNCEVYHVAAKSTINSDIKALLLQPGTVVLYPSETSVPLDAFISDVQNEQATKSGGISTIRTIVIIDGSWVTVQHILARNQALQPHNCQHVRLPSSILEADADADADAGVTSPNCSMLRSLYEAYGLRKEPSRGFLSTAEAAAVALRLVDQEGNRACEAILREFSSFLSLNSHIGCKEQPKTVNDGTMSSYLEQQCSSALSTSAAFTTAAFTATYATATTVTATGTAAFSDNHGSSMEQRVMLLPAKGRSIPPEKPSKTAKRREKRAKERRRKRAR